MATRVNINIDGFDAIRLKERADIEAKLNRQKFVEQTRAKDVRAKAEKLRKNDQKNGKILSSSGLPISRKQLPVKDVRMPIRKELAASTEEQDRKIAHFSIKELGSRTDDRSFSVVVTSGDGRQHDRGMYVSTSNFAGASLGYFVLPVGGEKAIIVAYGRIYGVFEDENLQDYLMSTNYPQQAWLCSFEKLKRIAIPPAVNSILRILNPGSGSDYVEKEFINGVEVNPFPPWYIESDPVGVQDTGRSVQVSSTPSVYEFLNKIKPFVPNNQIKQFPQSSRPILVDYRYTYEGFPGNDELVTYYSEWLGPDIYVDFSDPDIGQLLRPIPEMTKRFPPEWAEEILDYQEGPGAYYIPSTNNGYAWDWDDPDYCRSMCLALGFTASDLSHEA